MDKAKLIQSKVEEGKLSINEARILMDLEPIEMDACNTSLIRKDKGWCNYATSNNTRDQ
ncbi:hypothetical protein P4H81_07010 [Bacillus cereus]|nr:hypothetical protein [Bacillus cereus]MEB9179429.1 hypothetical protein [Bacillus cereus]